MEYLESTIETLVSDMYMWWKWLGTNQKTSIVTLMELSRVVYGWKIQLAMSEIKDTQ